MKSIVVFCGSNFGKDQNFKSEVKLLAKKLVSEDIHLVYGGAAIGVMGLIANEVLALGGKVTGVIPRLLSDKEIAHKGLTELIFVDSMHERKAKMAELSEGAVALPGGFGTLEELLELLTWSQLGLYRKPIGVFNYNGFYDGLAAQFDKCVDQKFLMSEHHERAIYSDNIENLLDTMNKYKWSDITKIWDS